MAVFYVTPQTDITALIASADVQGGDVLLLEDGIYSQSVLIEKSNLRISAKGHCAVFDGGNALVNGFSLANVSGVEISGLAIRNYLGYGVAIDQGQGNRIVANAMRDLGLSGVRVGLSAGNVIWNNSFENVYDGVLLINNSTFNWVLENTARACTWNGFESFLSEDAANAFVANQAFACMRNGFELFGVANLAYGNKAKDNAQIGFFISSLGNSAAIRNVSEDNGSSGFNFNSNDGFLSANEAARNAQAGILLRSDFTIAANNLVANNSANGIEIAGSYNFIYRNLLECNTPADIADNGTNNNFVDNRIKRCPCAQGRA